MKFQVSNLFRKKEEPVENNAVETAEAQVAGEAPKAEPATEQTAAAAEEEVTVCPKCKQETLVDVKNMEIKKVNLTRI